GRKCAKGHSMDPSWETCPYCEAEQRSNQRTSGFGTIDAADRQRTRVGAARPGPATPNRVTRAMATPMDQGGHVGAGDTRRITGILVTYTWLGQGEIFPIREGKNFVGSGEISSEAEHRDCDVCVPQDNTMSSEHALVLCRHGNYEIIDQISSNGTFLNGQMLKANQGTDLPNYAEIKTGSTLWTFIKIAAPAGETIQPAPKPAEETPPKTSGDKPTQVR
ncbi:MAG: FHA domain-containing protein, partial [Deltaproteobacteria bacterium]|nr:FHA domain-containing protein [Deltaproteobacteria bacterium]